MATSFISDSIFAGLKVQFENAMIELVSKIADGEGLDKDELLAKYLVNVMPAPKEATKAKAPRKPRKAKVTVEPVDPEATQDPNVEEARPSEPAKCSCLTAKGKPCSLKPLFGTTMCRVHTKKAEAEGAATTGTATGPIKDPKPKKAKEPKAPKAPKKAKKAKGDEPVHTHELDDEVHEDCELCQTHGCPLAEDPEEEFETVKSPPRSLRERLSDAAVMEEMFPDDDE